MRRMKGTPTTPPHGKWTPNAIHTAAVAVFRNHFFYNFMDAPRILADQLGLKTFKTALYVAQTYSMESADGDDVAMGHVDRCDGQLLWRSNIDSVTMATAA